MNTKGKDNSLQKIIHSFVDTCIIEDGSLLTKGEKLFTADNLNKVEDFLNAVKVKFDENNKKAREVNRKNKNKEARVYGIGDIFDGSVFSDKIVGTGFDKGIIIPILLHCNWLMYLCSDRQHKQSGAATYYKDDVNKYFQTDVEWAIGATFSGTSLDAMMFIVRMLIDMKKDEENDMKKDEGNRDIESICKNKTYKWNGGNQISDNAIKNILLYLYNPNLYLPIPAQNKKEMIQSGMGEALNIDIADTNQALLEIREEVRKIFNEMSEKEQDTEKKKYYEEIARESNPFWRPEIRPFWDKSTSKLTEEQLSDEVLLEYKKAMILYGPLGTSKSYQARQMAEHIVAEELRKQASGFAKCIQSLPKVLESHIHKLQLHPNYTYEDFIVGKKIKNGEVVVEKGFMLNLIECIATAGDKLPHVVILDEINRVDISRVFGELFTAMEPSYREQGVKLSVQDWRGHDIYLKVPENMYFIGTMNMIDFSLEQVDFALRRRFLWRLSTYDEDRLEDVISEKLKNVEHADEPENYAKNCSNLNDLIGYDPNLGKDYLIGHAFFAEIVDIYAKVKDWSKAKNILWQISILPTLEAYCGSMDASTKEQFIERCKNAFMPAAKEEKSKNRTTESNEAAPEE